MKTTSLAMPVGKPASFVSGRALMTRRAFFLITDCAGGSVVIVRFSEEVALMNRKFARPWKSLRADLQTEIR